MGAAIMAFGFYKVGQSNRERRAIKAANYEARAALVPFLQAREKCAVPFKPQSSLFSGARPGWSGSVSCTLLARSLFIPNKAVN